MLLAFTWRLRALPPVDSALRSTAPPDLRALRALPPPLIELRQTGRLGKPEGEGGLLSMRTRMQLNGRNACAPGARDFGRAMPSLSEPTPAPLVRLLCTL